MATPVSLTSLKSVSASPPALRGSPQTASKDFASLLDQELSKSSGVRFSAHAQERLAQREISLTSEEVSQLGRAVEKAASKGARETLVLMDRLALVVNVPNRTVITALSANEAGDTVFTNIDSAIVSPSSSAAQKTTEVNRLDPVRGGLSAAERQMRCTA